VVAALIADLKLIGSAHEVSFKTALISSLAFIGMALGYGVFLRYEVGVQASNEFFTAYAIEKVLSVDNLFVIALVFKFFATPKAFRHKVLFYGIVGAFVFRAIFIILGATAIAKTSFAFLGAEQFNIILFIFGGILVYKGIMTLKEQLSDEDEDEDFSETLGARLVRKIFKGKVLDAYHDDKFFVTLKTNEGMVKYGTLLLIVVGVVEVTDLVFAVDSIPAIFSVTQDKMILYTSNIFAILGLRSMYFLLENAQNKFHLLGYGLSLILAFIGAKMISAPWFHMDGMLSLYIVLGILAVTMTLSLIYPKKEEPVHV